MKTNKNLEDEELQNRIDLAAAYHLADIYGFSDIIWNHITCKTSANKKTFENLILAGGLDSFDQAHRAQYFNPSYKFQANSNDMALKTKNS